MFIQYQRLWCQEWEQPEPAGLHLVWEIVLVNANRSLQCRLSHHKFDKNHCNTFIIRLVSFATILEELVAETWNLICCCHGLTVVGVDMYLVVEILIVEVLSVGSEATAIWVEVTLWSSIGGSILFRMLLLTIKGQLMSWCIGSKPILTLFITLEQERQFGL